MNKIFLGISGTIIILFCGILLLDRHKLNHAYSKIGDVIEEKDLLLQQAQQKHQAENNRLLEMLNRQKQTFHIVTAHKQSLPIKTEADKTDYPKFVPVQLGTFAQFQNEAEFLEPGKRLASQVEKPVSAKKIVKAFQALQNKDVLFPEALFLSDPHNSQRVIHRQGILLEALCKELGYKAATTLCWDMSDMKHFCVTEITSPSSPTDRAEVYYGDLTAEPASDEGIVYQRKAVTLLLPFHRFELNEKDSYAVMSSDIHRIPVGGLYLHRLDVERHRDNTEPDWLLEYNFSVEPENSNKQVSDASKEDRKLASQTRLYAISLLNGKPIVSISSKGTQTFRIPFVAGRSSILILGDTPVLPLKITARSLKAE